MNDKIKKGQIIIYKAKDGPHLDVRLERDTVWLRHEEIAKLYGKERSVVTKHINKIFTDKEVDRESNVQFLHIANSDKPVAFYNLDVILAVGYRTSSARAIQFRKWTTNILKDYLLKGYAVNEKRLLEVKGKFQELQNTIEFLQKKSQTARLEGQAGEILSLLADYSKTLKLLEQYDKGKIKEHKESKAKFILTYENCLDIITKIKKELMDRGEASDLFGVEPNHQIEAIVKNIYQAFGGKELYKTLENKAANLLYLGIKDHPFVDGNKRISSFLFVYFLDKNDYLHRLSGEKKINDNALTALALLVAESDMKDKEQIIALITQLLQ